MSGFLSATADLSVTVMGTRCGCQLLSYMRDVCGTHGGRARLPPRQVFRCFDYLTFRVPVDADIEWSLIDVTTSAAATAVGVVHGGQSRLATEARVATTPKEWR